MRLGCFTSEVAVAIATEAPAPLTLREHIAAEEAPVAPPAPVTQPPVAVTPPAVEGDAAAEAEANSPKADAELSEAGRRLRMNRADKRAARIKEDNDTLARELHRRQELNALRASLDAPPTAAAPVAPAPVLDPSDPRPAFDVDKYSRTFPEDPYAGYLLDLNRWDRRQEHRQQAVAQRQQQGQQATVAAAARLQQHVEAGRAKFSDFDAVIDSVSQALAAGGPQRDADFTEFVLASPIGGDLMYAIGKDPAALTAVVHAKSRPELARAIVALEGRLTGAAVAPPPTTQAPPVPSVTAGGAAAASPIDTTRPGTSLRDHIAVEEAEIAERRKRGYRY